MLKSAEEKSIPFSIETGKIMHQMNKGFLTHPAVERLKREAQFDLVVLGWFMNDFNISIAAHFKCPAVLITGTPALKPHRDIIGNPSGSSIGSFPLFPVHGSVLSFTDRLWGHLYFGLEFLGFNFLDWFVYQPTYDEHFPAPQYPSFAEAKKISHSSWSVHILVNRNQWQHFPACSK